MYIMTEQNGIINLNHYPRVDVYPDQNSYFICAFTVPDSIKIGNERITIVKFEKREDADYAISYLYSVLSTGRKTWDMRSVPLLSDVWNKVKENHQKDTETWVLTNDVILNVTGPDHLTIEYPSDIYNRWNKKTLRSKQQIVGDELIESLRISKGLKDSNIPSPVQYCLWKPSDEKSENHHGLAEQKRSLTRKAD